MTCQTRVIQTVIMLGGTVDDLILDTHGGHTILVLGRDASVCLSTAPQDVLDKLATLTAQAAAEGQARALKAVS